MPKPCEHFEDEKKDLATPLVEEIVSDVMREWEEGARQSLKSSQTDEPGIDDIIHERDDRILSLIKLIRKKDESLKYYVCECISDIENRRIYLCGRCHALALTEELK